MTESGSVHLHKAADEMRLVGVPQGTGFHADKPCFGNQLDTSLSQKMQVP